MKKIKIKYVVVVILFLILSYFGYKFYNLKKYDYPTKEGYEEVLKGITPAKELNVTKKELNESDYISVGKIKIRNDFKEYQLIEEDANNTNIPIQYAKYENGEAVSKIQFHVDELSATTTIDTFLSDVELLSSEDESSNSTNKYNSANRKKLLEDNNITNDIEFYDFIVKNYPLKSNIFTSVETMKMNYAFNTFFDVAIPLVDELKVIKGDYEGFVYIVGKSTEKPAVEVEVFHNNKRYGFLTNDKRFLDENYLTDIVGTIDFLDN